MSIIGKATLQSDENGLVTLQCDRCKSRFKMLMLYLFYQVVIFTRKLVVNLYCKSIIVMPFIKWLLF